MSDCIGTNAQSAKRHGQRPDSFVAKGVLFNVVAKYIPRARSFDLSNLNAALEGSMSLHSSVSFSDCLELRDVLSPFKERFISTDLIPAAPPLCCVSVSEANLVHCIYLVCKHSQDTLP